MHVCEMIKRVLKNPFDVQATECLYKRAKSISEAYLKYKIQIGTLNTQLFGCNFEQLAITCIANVFERDADNRLVQFERFKAFNDIDAYRDDEIKLMFRKLIHVNINDEIFKLYNDYDPELGRIIRNIKVYVNNSSDCTLLSGGRIKFGQKDESDKPVLPYDYLEVKLVPILKKFNEIPSIISHINDLIANELEYKKEIPIGDLALTIRSASYCLLMPVSISNSTEQDIDCIEYSRVIDTVVDKVGDECYNTYVFKRKIDEGLYRAYLGGIKKLLNSYIEHGNGKESIAYFIKSEYPDFNENEYRSVHRPIVEYLMKRARSKMETLFLAEK